MDTDKTGRGFERQVADCYRALGAKVERDRLMAGHQIDVYVEMAGPDRSVHHIAVEAKDWQSPVGIDVVGNWVLVVDGLRRAGLIDEGVIVSPAGIGFTKPAREAVAKHVERGLPLRLLELDDLQAPAGVDLDHLREEYLAFLANSYRRLNFRGIVQTKNLVELPLAEIYVSLSVAPSAGERVPPREVMEEAALRERAERAERLAVEDLLRKEARLVVLGDPGAGKTTFLHYAALALAEGREATRQRLGLTEEWLPICLPLAAYNERLQKERISLEDYVLHFLGTRSFDRPGMNQLFARALEAGRVLLLLDELDAVGGRAERLAVARQVESWANSHGPRGNRVVVTSRSVGYDEAPLACDFRAYTLSPFGPAEIGRFARQWCIAYQRWADPGQPEEMAVEKGQAEAALLVAEIHADLKVESLASNPLLVTIIALIHYKGTRLPDHRVKLYDLCIQTLVETWREARSEAGPLGKALRVANEIKVLAPFALWLQERAPGPGGAARRDAVRAQLVELMARQFKGDREAAEAEADLFLELGQRQTGLLVERGEGWFGFFHPTFKEYLAARACVLEGQIKGVGGTWEALRPHLSDPLWHEVILFTVGYKAIVESQDEATAYLVRQIAAAPGEHGENVVLAGRCLADVGRDLVPADCWDEVVNGLIPIMQDLAPDGQPNKPPLTPITIRYAAAETLDRLGWLPKDLNTWVEVGGTHHIPHTADQVYVGRYPVTNVQFALFIAAGGYENPKYWSGEDEDSAAWRWRMTEHNVSWRGEGPVAQPEYWDHPRFGRSRRGYPVVGVSWYEASAYAAWLTELLRRRRAGEELEPVYQGLIAGLPEHVAVVRLPADEEWVAAAGGAQGDRYPWGQDWDESRANTEEGGIRGTTPVAMYPSGRSPDGVWDMGGNVWEWVATWYGKEREYRILRGGSWDVDPRGARVGVRVGVGPDDSGPDLGFRLVGSPACSDS